MTDNPFTERRLAHEANVRKMLDAISPDAREEWLIAVLANARAGLEEVRDERERMRLAAETQTYGADDARRSAAYRARIVELEAMVRPEGK